MSQFSIIKAAKAATAAIAKTIHATGLAALTANIAIATPISITVNPSRILAKLSQLGSFMKSIIAFTIFTIPAIIKPIPNPINKSTPSFMAVIPPAIPNKAAIIKSLLSTIH